MIHHQQHSTGYCFTLYLTVRPNCLHKQRCISTLEHAATENQCVSLQVCKAVAGLHQREIVHGDLRPANVMWFSSSFSMKLVDFARWADKGLPTPLNLTLRYAAPEVTPLPALPLPFIIGWLSYSHHRSLTLGLWPFTQPCPWCLLCSCDKCLSTGHKHAYCCNSCTTRCSRDSCCICCCSYQELALAAYKQILCSVNFSTAEHDTTFWFC